MLFQYFIFLVYFDLFQYKNVPQMYHNTNLHQHDSHINIQLLEFRLSLDSPRQSFKISISVKYNVLQNTICFIDSCLSCDFIETSKSTFHVTKDYRYTKFNNESSRRAVLRKRNERDYFYDGKEQRTLMMQIYYSSSACFVVNDHVMC